MDQEAASGKSGTSRLTRRSLLASASAAATAVITLPVLDITGVLQRHSQKPTHKSPPLLPTEIDAVIVGANVAGIAAAIELQTAGLSTLVLEQSSHVGGMTTAGLCIADIGDPTTMGGFSQKLYRDIGSAYGLSTSYSYTPDVSQRVINQYVRKAGIRVAISHPLAKLSYEKSRWHIYLISDHEIECKYVIDATYEGDLLDLADIPHSIGRESVNQYHESLAGIRHPAVTGGDPYRIENNPASGPLAGVYPSLGTVGAADAHVQSGNFRLTLTNGANRRPWHRPPNYHTSNYKITARAVAVGDDPAAATNPIAVANGLFDLNNSAIGGTDLVAQGGRTWIETKAKDRPALQRKYRDFTLGLLFFLANEPTVPAAVSQRTNAIGLVPEQFTSNDNFPPMFYVREGRRMIGREVITQYHVYGDVVADDPVAISSVGIDCHGVRNVVDNIGQLAVEGELLLSHLSFGIPMGAMLPRDGPPGFVAAVPVSATHIGWCGLRFEPVFGMLGQAAGILVAIAAKMDIAPDEVPYPVVREALLRRGAILPSV